MRLWSIHPKYLDSLGLVALWREGLLAQKVLLGKTRGYKNHPQLNRFKDSSNPIGAISKYLQVVLNEAQLRNYNFNSQKIATCKFSDKIVVTDGQLQFEYNHLINKLKVRTPKKYKEILGINQIEAHSLFVIVKGGIEDWEVV
ncbi:MAG: pyrimidine dimer DNA glycosylase/endonuclease V [Ignavibacteriaceae bacterium]|nr:pyrimidine dimer DNA glycosylase/endonuclease V [Ignavibacteriaceae bacterium]